MCNITTTPIYTEETRVCIKCGKSLPLSNFNKRGLGYRSVCKQYLKTENGSSDKFKDFTSRELIDELKLRGYEGQLTKKIVETIKL